MKKPVIILFFSVVFFVPVIFGQKTPLSIATDLDFQHSLKKGQRYWAGGQTVQGDFHFMPKEAMYVWVAYYSLGKFNNNLAAIAKLPSTNPQQINFVNKAQMRFKHVSVGWKHYFKGSYTDDEKWNLYGYAGFGLMLGLVQNVYSISIDTSAYTVPVVSGKANFKRLTLDLGLGWEVPLGADIFFYNELRVWVPTTDYPSAYIFVNKNAPLVASLNFGMRILFD
ncbi:MAG TPA: hypothetical protein VET23_12945 [Chitinophagaceae bacterium]|nr:hypothetical protein [Chitinophagaceae bacterium]